MPESIPADPNLSAREARLRQVIDDALVRRAAGEELSDDALCEQFPELLPELASELRKLKVIGAARALSLLGTERQLGAEVHETAAYRPASGSRELRIRCPLCREPFEIVVDAPLEDLLCGFCDGRFSLAGDDPNLKTREPISRIARFELVERIGMGGFGTVWKAQDTELGRTVALKIPRRGRLGPDEIDEFKHEARVAAKLKHASIVSVHEIGQDGDNVYIVSDFIEGRSLAKFNDEHRLTHRQAAELIATICDALHFAHQQGVVHRDLKPGNILLNPEGVPHITDFGLAAKSTDGVAITTEGEILGTPAYMSPEQARGDLRLDQRTDIYSLGVMLFELLTDHLPFRGNVAALVRHAIYTQPPSPRLLNASVPRDLETICLKCLQKDSGKRYSSARELAEELRRFLRGDPILARPISATERLWRWCKQNPRVPILSTSLLATVAVAYLIAWVWFGSIYRRSDRVLTEQALSNVHFTAESVAHRAGHELGDWFQKVEDAAQDKLLIQTLRDIARDEELTKFARQLSVPPAHDDPAADRLRREVEQNALRLAVQEWTEERKIGNKDPVFAWFVQLPDGLQIAREPMTHGGEKTIGRNYAWRAYFHGGEADREKAWRPSDPARDVVRKTHLSPAFVSQYTNEWVVVVSTPIKDNEQVVGVLGLMLRVGSFAELPGSQDEIARASSAAQRFAVLVDARPPEQGQILQHPLYHEPAARRGILDQAEQAALRAPVGDWQRDPHYRDPFAAVDPRYDQRWLAARWPVEVRGAPTGLNVVVQENYDQVIGGGLDQMRRGLALLSLVTLGLAAAMVIPAWIVILRMVR